MNTSMRECRTGMDKHATGQAKSFGQVIRERRIELGFTQEQLAERIGENVRQSDVSRMERDYISLPRRDRLEALAVALDVTPGYLLMHSGWITREEQERLDGPTGVPPALIAAPAEFSQHDGNHGVSGALAPEISSVEGQPTEPSLLHDVLERARYEQERTGELLRRTADTIESARRSRRLPASR
jgi:transcriptional regulator with XRE-family HTH domain